MKKLLIIFLLAASIHFVFADTINPDVKGIAIMTTHSGAHSVSHFFTDITWPGPDFDGGYVTHEDGKKEWIVTKDIGKIIYFDAKYYYVLDHDVKIMPYRIALRPREIVINTNFSRMISQVDLAAIQQSENMLKAENVDLGTVASPHNGDETYVKPPLDPYILLLDDQIDKFKNGQRLLDGKWITEKELESQLKSTTGLEPKNYGPVTFSTKDGKAYSKCQTYLNDGGLSVMTSDGGTTVTFEQLPDDLSAFPKSWSTWISAKREMLLAKDSPSINNVQTPPVSQSYGTAVLAESPNMSPTATDTGTNTSTSIIDWAGLGETEDRCVQKYGQIIKTLEPDQITIFYHAVGFTKDGVTIGFTFINGRAARVIYGRQGDAELSDAEIQTFLKANSQGKEWEAIEGVPDKRLWGLEGRLLACYDQGILTISNRTYLDAEKARKNGGQVPLQVSEQVTMPTISPSQIQSAALDAKSQVVKGGYVETMMQLCDKYHLDQVNMPLSNDPKQTQKDFCIKIGEFLDNEQNTSGSYFAFEADPSFIKTGLVLEKPDDFVKQGVINASIYEILWNRMNGEETGRSEHGPYKIDVKDIPFLLYCYNKCDEWTKASEANQLTPGVTKEIGTSDSGKIKATFIVTDQVDLTIGTSHFSCPDPRVGGKDLISEILYKMDGRIEAARTSYKNKIQEDSEQQKSQRKAQDDQNNVNNVLK